MRTCDVQVKANFVRTESTTFGPVPKNQSTPDDAAMAFRKLTANSSSREAHGPLRGRSEATRDQEIHELPRKTRSRSRTFTFSKDRSPSKKRKADRPPGHSRAKSTDTIASTRSSTTALPTLSGTSKLLKPQDFICYLQKERQPRFIEVGKVHKLRQVLRNETVAWVDDFISNEGMGEVLGLLYRTIEVEWREDHEDSLLHETLLCLKALFTTSSALKQMDQVQERLFPALLHLLLDEERKGPSEFATRSIIVSLLHTYLTSSPPSSLAQRAGLLLSYLRDPSKPEDKQPPTFIATIYHSRPYRVWNNEILNVTKEVFWIFMHHFNVIPFPSESATTAAASFADTHFPKERPPVPAAPYIGGVEWDATNYLAAHLDLLNAIIASLPAAEERNSLRRELRDSGFEKCMGGQLRVCKEKFYGHVHAGLTTWIGAASADGWPFEDVRQGPPKEERKSSSPRKTASPKKKQPLAEAAPVLAMPKLDLAVGVGTSDGDGWL